MFVLCGGHTVLAEDVRAGPLTIAHPWARATPGGSTIAAGYFVITNTGDVPDRLVSATVDVATRTTPHEMSMTDGVMAMRPLPQGLAIPAHGTVAFKPGGDHLMIEGLKRPLKRGESFAGTLTFEKAGSVPVTFSVEGIGAQTPAAGGGMPGMKMN